LVAEPEEKERILPNGNILGLISLIEKPGSDSGDPAISGAPNTGEIQAQVMAIA
jgi:hypothetical protein